MDSISFAGLMCELNHDECTSSPCSNDGICQDRYGHYECLCQPGWTGIGLQIELNEPGSLACAILIGEIV